MQGSTFKNESVYVIKMIVRLGNYFPLASNNTTKIPETFIFGLDSNQFWFELILPLALFILGVIVAIVLSKRSPKNSKSERIDAIRRLLVLFSNSNDKDKKTTQDLDDLIGQNRSLFPYNIRQSIKVQFPGFWIDSGASIVGGQIFRTYENLAGDTVSTTEYNASNTYDYYYFQFEEFKVWKKIFEELTKYYNKKQKGVEFTSEPKFKELPK